MILKGIMLYLVDELRSSVLRYRSNYF